MYELTYGKVYETIEFKKPLVELKYPDRYYQVINDRNHLEYYSKDTFVTLETWRDMQVSNILDEDR